ncbi:hypothetical protein GOV10_00695 [Candidatus Woesearchaeota archaeon]|nr:hypothetical protein [Candidatus Woesearchaeota archaeon]
MIELSIPQAGEETKQAKDLVFSILSERQPLSVIQLSNIIKGQYNVSLTYHAVMKAVDSLLSKGVLLKEQKKYRISKEWLVSLKTTVDRLLTTYDKKKEVRTFSADMANEQYAAYTFNNLIDCDNFWDDLLFYLTKHIKNEEHHSFTVHSHYNWWFLINFGQETKLHTHLVEKGFDTHFLIIGNNDLNQWAKKLYESMKVTAKIIEDKHVDETMTLNIIGDTVIQAKYPPDLIKMLRRIYNNYKKTQDIPLKVITELANKPCEIKLVVFKNREIANSLREKYRKKFK